MNVSIVTLAEFLGCALIIAGGLALAVNAPIGWLLGAIGYVLLYEARP